MPPQCEYRTTPVTRSSVRQQLIVGGDLLIAIPRLGVVDDVFDLGATGDDHHVGTVAHDWVPFRIERVREGLAVVVAQSALELLPFATFSRTSGCDACFAHRFWVAACAANITSRTRMCSAEHRCMLGEC